MWWSSLVVVAVNGLEVKSSWWQRKAWAQRESSASLCVHFLLLHEVGAHSLTSWAHSSELKEALPSLHLGSVRKGDLLEKQNCGKGNRNKWAQGSAMWVAGLLHRLQVPLQLSPTCICAHTAHTHTIIFAHMASSEKKKEKRIKGNKGRSGKGQKKKKWSL